MAENTFDNHQLKTVGWLVFGYLKPSHVLGVCSAVCTAWEEAASEYSSHTKVKHHLSATLSLPNINARFCWRLGLTHGMQPEDYVTCAQSIVSNNYYELAEKVLPRVSIDWNHDEYGIRQLAKTTRMACTVMMLDPNPCLKQYSCIDLTIAGLAWTINKEHMSGCSFCFLHLASDDKYLGFIQKMSFLPWMKYFKENEKNSEIVKYINDKAKPSVTTEPFKVFDLDFASLYPSLVGLSRDDILNGNFPN